MKLKVSDKSGSVSAEIMQPKKMKALLTFAHGAGAPMDHSFMVAMSEEFAKHDIGTLRFNFPFMENQKGRPDAPLVAQQTVAVAAAYCHEKFPKVPLYLSGKSFGGRMSSQYVSKEQPDFISGLVFLGFPLHAPGALSVDRADHLKEIKVPMLFLQGTRDALANLELMTKVTKGLKQATLVTFEGADHSFKAGRKKDLLPELAKAVSDFVG